MTTEGANYLFIIDTNQYAGNFEREMTAYLTGHVGECEVGYDMAKSFRKEVKEKNLFKGVASVPDEYGCFRPATIWPNPRYASDGMGGEYLIEGANQEKLCKRYVKSVENYANIEGKKKFIERVRNKERGTEGYTLRGVEKELKEAEKRIEEAKKIKTVPAYPAYLSVGIWFDTKPTEEEIRIMKERAEIFPTAYDKANRKYNLIKGLKIEGFRLISFKKSASEEAC